MPVPLPPTNPWSIGIDAASVVLPFIGGGLAGGEQQATARAEREQRWKELMAQIAMQREQLASTNTVNAERTGSAQAGLPLADEAMSGLNARFGLGPARFGQTGAFNAASQGASAAYRPGQNQGVNNLNDIYSQALNRFGVNPRRYQG